MRRLLRRDTFPAAFVGALTLAIYLSTLAPGVIGFTDTPKFQFVGRILGVSHNPGYPLYSVLTHVFGYVPIGSLAYRINLFSALFGALLSAVAYLLARRLESTPLAAAAAVTAFACGAAVWSVSTVAEVYTLHVFLVAAILLALVRWRQTKRESLFFLAVALFAVGEGHHTDIVLMLPAIVLYACASDWRFASRPRTILFSASICLAGLLQYAFIILRTRQGAYVESPARNVSEIFDVIRGRQFAAALLPIDSPALLHDRLPLVARIFAQEISIAGLALALVGAIVLVRRQWRDAVLLLLTIAGFAAFGLVYTVADVADFMIPAYLACWLLAAIAVTAIGYWIRLRTNRTAAAVAAAAFILLPAYLYVRNHDEQDLSHRWAPVRFLDALFSNLPDRSAVLHEDFLVDRMLYYKTLGEGATRGRDVLALVPAEYPRVADLSREGYSIFAFQKSAKLLRLEGADFEYTPYRPAGGSLHRFCEDLPRGSIIAVAIPGARYDEFTRSISTGLDRIGARLPAGVVENAAIIGVVGATSALSDRRGLGWAVARVARGAQIGATRTRAPLEISAEASQLVATIKLGPREILRSSDTTVAVWNPKGVLLQTFTLPNGNAPVPTRAENLDVFRLRRLRAWEEIPPTVRDISALTATGNLVLRLLPPTSTVVLYLGRTRPLSPALFDMPEMPHFSVETYATEEPRDRERLLRDLVRDQFPSDARLLRETFVYRLAIAPPRTLPEAFAMQVSLGGVPDVAWARTTEGPGAACFDVDLGSHLEPIDGHTGRLHMARDWHEQLIGAGWSGVEVDEWGTFRRMRAPQAELLIPAAERSPLTISLQASPGPLDTRTGTVALQVFVNERALGASAIQAGWNRYEWDVPAMLITKVNSVVLKAPAAGVEIADVLVIRP